ncbi:hypothetical protein RJT34_06471 [Clitoria ternatea]|uniref:Uncharacterized protein n=1 Tax=Clitoria ternatea TaxID=43366 RepID=A0AAN9PTP6_CLITE
MVKVGELTREERDQLQYSIAKKKPKVTDADPNMDLLVEEIDANDEMGEDKLENVGNMHKGTLETARRMALQRCLVSYKDVCLSINGTLTYYSCSDTNLSKDEKKIQGKRKT